MDEIVLIYCMALLIIVAAVCSIVLSRAKLPPLIGFLVAGIVLHNFFTVGEEAESVLSVFSNLGLIMLMFAIGMEIDIRKIKDKGLFALIVAGVQLPLMVLGGAIAGLLMGFDLIQCIVLGALISGSSTAVVMAVLKSQGTLDPEHIEMLVLITIMEDIGQVVMLSMITPLMQGSTMELGALAQLIINIAIFMGVCFLLGMRMVPRAIDWLSSRISDELTSMLCVGLAFFLAFMANLIGLSVAIGAFLMGVMIASTVKREIVEHFVSPLRILFMAMFFISVGMEVTISGLTNNVLMIISLFLLFVILKTSTVFLGYWIGNEQPRNGFVSAVGLCAMGEFAFIITKQAYDLAVVDETFYSSVIGAAMLTMFALPFMTRFTGRFWDSMERRSPQGLRNFCLRVNTRRSEFYKVLNSMSKKARHKFRTSIGYTYVCVVLIIAIETVLYFFYTPVAEWLMDNVGGTAGDWDLVLLSVNFWLLFFPCRKLVNELRMIAYSFYLGKLKAEEMRKKEEAERLRFFQGMNPFLAAVFIDWFLILFMPIGSRSPYSGINLIVAIILASVIRAWRIQKGRVRLAPLENLDDDEGDAGTAASE